MAETLLRTKLFVQPPRLAQGDLAAAALWADEAGLQSSDEPTRQNEAEYITLARLLLAQTRTEEADALLRRLLESAQTAGRISRVIEILILRAMALKAAGRRLDAIAALERSLDLAKAGGYVRTFVD